MAIVLPRHITSNDGYLLDVATDSSFTQILSRFESLDVEMQIFETFGKPVQTIMNESMEPGYYEVSFNGDGLLAGIYI